jgi:NAD dependent epimerase/dehydratase family enzyme
VLRRPAVFRVPRFALRLALGEMADLALTGQRAVPRALEALGFRFRFPQLESALRDLLG